MKYLLLVLITLLYSTLASAQSNYKPGYIVTLKGDTVNGFIDYREWDNNPKSISFTRDGATQKELYTVENAIAFGVKGYEKYQRATVWLSQDKTGLDNLPTAIDTSRTRETVFLKRMNTGNNAIMYAYSDDLKSRFYVSEQGHEPYELAYHLYVDPKNESNILGGNTFKNQLQAIAAKYRPHDEKLINKIKNAVYKEYAITEIAYELNGTTNENKTTGNNYRFFAGIGVNSSSTKFKGAIALADAGSRTSTLPLLNFGIDVYFNKNVGTWLFRTTLGFTDNKVSYLYDYSNTAGTNFNEALKFNGLAATLSPQIVYNAYNTNKIKVYLSAGFGISYYIHSTKEYNVTTTYTLAKPFVTATPFPKLSSGTFNFPVKIGLVLNNKFDIYAGYVPKTSLNSDAGYDMNVTAYQAGINYLFGGK